jgi:alkylation response protein AidB-like acyl-CoA dehydrogenase
MMDFNLTEEQALLRDSAARYLREVHPFNPRQHLTGRTSEAARANWQALAELGWLGLSLPESLEGPGCSFVEDAIVLEELGRALAPEPLLAFGVPAACVLQHAGDFLDRSALAGEFVQGKARIAWAHDEAPGARHATKAMPGTGGWTLSGYKQLVLGGSQANAFFIRAAVEGVGSGPAVALFYVPVSQPGVHCKPYRLVDGSDACDLVLDGIRLQGSALVAEGDAAQAIVDEVMDRQCLGAVAEMIGCMEAVLAVSAEHLKTRVQFGKPLASFQALQHLMADMFIEVQETRSILFHGLAGLHQAPTQRARRASAAKSYAGTAARLVGQGGIHVHGGLGVTEEVAVGHYYRRIVTLERLFGDCGFHRTRFARIDGTES